MTRGLEDSWLSDDPLDHFDDELFGRSHLVDLTLAVLARVGEQSESSTIGLVGAWGSGKSSVLNAVMARLRAPGDVTSRIMRRGWGVAEFNPWLASGPAELYSRFFHALRDGLPADARWNETRDNIASWGRRIAPFTFAAGHFGVDGPAAVDAIVDRFEEDVLRKRERVIKALRDFGRPILVVVDDLDRLSANELLHVFKLVRLLGRLPHVYYLLSYDEHTLVDLLSHTDLVATEDKRRSLDYLEKIVQVRVDMPLLRPYETDRVVASAVTRLAAKHNIPLVSGERDGIMRRFDEVLSKRLRSPRAIKRLFGQVDAFLGSMGAEVDFGDYLVITWLRTMEPGVYRLIQTHRTEMLGLTRVSVRGFDEPKLTAEERRAWWLRALEDAHVARADREDILWLLGTLFPVMADVYRNADPEDSGRYPEPTLRKVSHPDYFDRFFAFGVPPDDLPDTIAQAAISDLILDTSLSEAVRRVESAFSKQPELAIAKLVNVVEKAAALSPAVVYWLHTMWERIPRDRRTRIEHLVASALTKLPDNDIRAVVEQTIATDGGLLFMAAVFHSVDADSYGAKAAVERREAVAELIAPIIKARYVARFDELLAAVPSPFDLDEVVTDIMWYWRWHDPSTLRAFLGRAMASSWPALDAVAWLVPRSTSDGVVWRVGRHMSTEHFEELFDLDHLAEAVPDLWTSPDIGQLSEGPATREALEAWGRAAIKDRLARRPAASPDGPASSETGTAL